VVGYITQEIINLLALGIAPQPVFWGESNREHVEMNHPSTYAKYSPSSVLESIIVNGLKAPGYVGKRNDAVEYIKLAPDGENLKIAVRASKKGVYFVRTVYPISQDEVDNFLAKKTLVKVS
jgi:ribosomal protein S8